MPLPVRDRLRQGESDQSTATAEREACPECGGPIVRDEEHAERACADCGLVIEEAALDRGPEWRAFDSEEKDEKRRVGAPTTTLLHDKGLSNQISRDGEDASGTTLDPQQRATMHRLRTWDERFRAKDAQERTLKHALGEIKRMGSALGLPEHVRETAADSDRATSQIKPQKYSRATLR